MHTLRWTLAGVFSLVLWFSPYELTAAQHTENDVDTAPALNHAAALTARASTISGGRRPLELTSTLR